MPGIDGITIDGDDACKLIYLLSDIEGLIRSGELGRHGAAKIGARLVRDSTESPADAVRRLNDSLRSALGESPDRGRAGDPPH